MKFWPLFENIHEEPEFLDVLNELEARFEKQHEQISKLLKRQGVIDS